MALFRQAFRASSVVRQCNKVAIFQQQQQKRGYSTTLNMPFTLASPSDVYYSNQHVEAIDVPTMGGHVGVRPNHVPLLAVLKPGVVSVLEESGERKSYFVSSGSLTVNPDSSVQILAEEAHPLDRFDMQAVKDGIAQAEKEKTEAGTDKQRAKAQIAQDCLLALEKALTSGV